ncbi:hypothetical protein [Streptomyces sp. NPDC000618]|uniref:hypothetical protein n=1 Tax=Streptomyces sp. NPDC000618 TaxID=3154265 RepID=UPI003322711B
MAIADTNGLYRIVAKKDPRHAEHAAALTRIGHLVVSPPPLAKQADLRRFEIPDVGPHFRTVVSVAAGYL